MKKIQEMSKEKQIKLAELAIGRLFRMLTGDCQGSVTEYEKLKTIITAISQAKGSK